MSDVIEGAVALGTLATAGAALLGLRSASATALVAQRQLAAEWQPLLLDEPLDESEPGDRTVRLPNGERISFPDASADVFRGSAVVQTTGESGDYVVAPFRNVGGGIARIVELSLFLRNREVDAAGRVEQQFLAPGESTRAVLHLSRDSPQRGQFVDCARQLGYGIAVGVAYTDLSGKSRGEVVFELSRELGRGWQVGNVSQHVLPTPLRQTMDGVVARRRSLFDR